MRIILPKDKETEIKARLEYLFGVFNLYFMVKREDNYCIELTSIPYNTLDYLLIIGHNGFVERYMINRKDTMREENIVLISCELKILRYSNLFSDKNIYVSQESYQYGQTTCYKGQDYGFEFNISDAELDLYNSKENIDNKISNVFVLLRKKT